LSFLEDHLARLRTAVDETYDLSQIPKWITDHTRLKGSPYSFKDHEFQEKVLSDTSRVVNVSKIAQVGMSECMARWLLGVCEVFPGFGAIYTLPFAGDAEGFCRTRVDPIIASSPRLKTALNPKLNSAEVKQFHESLLYFRGTNGKTQAISTPADAIMSDEIDRSDPDILKQFTSRLKHSSYALRRNFSTPTVPGWGISLEMETSRRFRNLCKCDHCANWFLPSYFEHVKIPGYSKSLRELNKGNIHHVRYQEAALLCPFCGKAPSLAPQHRAWVQENPNDAYDAAGYYISPFDAPAFNTPAKLTYSSTEYGKYSEFMNQELGLTSEDSSEALTLQDLNDAKTSTDLFNSSAHCMGIDMGLTCHISIGRLDYTGTLFVVYRQEALIGELEDTVLALKKKFRVINTVVDAMPYTDTVIRMQRKDKNLYGASYNTAKNAPIYEIKKHDGDASNGRMPLSIAKIRNNEGFEELLGMFKSREVKIYIQEQAIDERADRHYLDMRRVQLYDENMDLSFQWKKSKTAQDHFFHSLLYLLAACRLRGVSTSVGSLAVGMPMRIVRAVQKAF
jgi:hypothetical protein